MSETTTASGDTAGERELAVKRALEAAMRSEPDNAVVRTTYFQQLERIARTHVGLCEAYLPELPHPLLLRCGTSDVDNLMQIFLRCEYGFPLERPTPARILDIGAYAGYAAVALANRFPQAQILSVEPAPASFRMLVLNTLPYRNIAHLNAAAWTHAGRMRVAAMHGGDWGYQLAEVAEPEQGGYPCHTVDEILRLRGWDRAEFVKCDIEGAEAALFADPAAEWLGKLDVLAVETHDHMVPNSAATVAACFEPSLFTHARHRELEVYQRRLEETPIAQPPVMPLIHSGPGLRAMAVRNVTPEQWGFFLFDDRGCQLHPNAPGGLPAQLVFTLDCQGQNRFSTVIFHAGQPSEDIIFRVRILRLSDSAVMMDGARRVVAGAAGEWKEPTPKLIGRHEVILETEMAPGASRDMNAWARWIEPRLS
jgi:FkbM family methyltransferase